MRQKSDKRVGIGELLILGYLAVFEWFVLLFSVFGVTNFCFTPFLPNFWGLVTPILGNLVTLLVTPCPNMSKICLHVIRLLNRGFNIKLPANYRIHKLRSLDYQRLTLASIQKKKECSIAIDITLLFS